MGNPEKNLIRANSLCRRADLYLYTILSLFFLAVCPPAGRADIRFKEVTTNTGIHHAGTSFGASWGDFDGDSYQKALNNAEIIIQEWIETAQDLGRSIPEPRGRLMYA